MKDLQKKNRMCSFLYRTETTPRVAAVVKQGARRRLRHQHLPLPPAASSLSTNSSSVIRRMKGGSFSHSRGTGATCTKQEMELRKAQARGRWMEKGCAEVKWLAYCPIRSLCQDAEWGVLSWTPTLTFNTCRSFSFPATAAHSDVWAVLTICIVRLNCLPGVKLH